MSLILQDQLTLSTKTKEQVEKNTQDIAKNTQDIQDLEDKLAVVYKFKGSVDTYADLPTENNQTGDVWDVKEDDMNYAWTDDGEWDKLGPTVDLSGYVPTSRTINNKALESDITLEPSDIGAATAAQGELADTALQSEDLKTINGTSIIGEGDITIDSLPNQAGNANKFLTTDGMDASWAELNITNKFLTGVTDPTSSTTAEFVGQLYRNTTTKTEWTCDDPHAIISTSGQNWTTTGTLTVSDGIISGFSTSNYCETNVNIPENYIFITRFIDDSPTSYSGYLGNKNNLTYGLKHGVGSDPRFFLQGPSGSAGNNTKALTWTWVKIVYTSSEKKMYWIEDNNYTMSTVPWGTGFDISSAGAAFNGAHLVFGRSQAGSIISCSARFDFKNTVIYQADGTTEIWTPFVNVYGSLWTQLANQSEVNKKLENTATKSTSLTIAGTSSILNYSTNVGVNSEAKEYSTSLGAAASASGSNSVAVGFSSYIDHNSQGSIVVGYGSSINSSSEDSIVIGRSSRIGQNAFGAIQIGFMGTNSEAGSLKVSLGDAYATMHNYKLLDKDGTIPVDRYIAMIGADGTNTGTTGSVPAPAATDNTKFLRGDGTWAEAGGNASYDDTTGTIEL